MPRKSPAPDAARDSSKSDKPSRSQAPNRRKAAAAKATHAAAAKQSGPQRLQRLLASAGYGSRRQCEDLIEAGRVSVDGELITKLGTSADPDVNKIHIDGTLLRKQKLVYYAVNKPDGVLSTNRDPQGRPRVVDLVPKSERVFPVGRLDRTSTGLMLLTNDGDLAQQLTHPKYGVRKVYRVIVAGKVDGETMRTMRKGIYISEGFVKVEGAKILKSRSKSTEMEIILREGKNREIRRILARLGHKVQQLTRIAIGPLRLGDMPPGAHRVLGRDDVQKLHLAVERSKKEAEAESKEHEGKRGTKKRSTKRRPHKSRSGYGGNTPPPKSHSGGQGTGKRRSKSSAPSGEDFLPTESTRVGAVIGGEGDSTESTTSRKPGRKRSVGGSRSTSQRSDIQRGGTKKRGTKKRSVKKARSSKKRSSVRSSTTGASSGRGKPSGGRSSRGTNPTAKRGKKKPGRRRG